MTWVLAIQTIPPQAFYFDTEAEVRAEHGRILAEEIAGYSKCITVVYEATYLEPA